MMSSGFLKFLEAAMADGVSSRLGGKFMPLFIIRPTLYGAMAETPGPYSDLPRKATPAIGKIPEPFAYLWN